MHGGRNEAKKLSEQRDVLKYWRLIELFSPQTVPKPEPKNHIAPVVSWRPGRPLPWDVLPPATTNPTRPKVWQHTVYLGVYELEHIYRHLHEVFPAAADAYDERRDGLSACAALVIDGSGRVIDDSQILSSASWAIGRTSDAVPQSVWFDGFDDARDEFRSRTNEFLGEISTKRRITEDPRIDDELLISLRRIAHTTANIVPLENLARPEIYIKSNRVDEDKAADLPEFDFINSFYLDELGQVTSSAFGAGLDLYLTPDSDISSTARVDVRNDPEVVVTETAIEKLPHGRWPSDPKHPLSSSQQFAVNQALNTLGRSSGLMGVNGPPGTGKTTMLRDLVANNVVRRATVLAQMNSPEQAFSGQRHTWKSGNYTRSVRQLREDVTGFEMVVASSNNAAVANVSDELPRQDQIHEGWHRDACYFADLATSIATDGSEGASPSAQSWALISARLGNKSNRTKFKRAAWFGVDKSVRGLQDTLKMWESDPSTRPSWSDACERFRSSGNRVEGLQDAARRAGMRLERRSTLDVELQSTERQISHGSESILTIELHSAQAQGARAELQGLVAAQSNRRNRHMEVRPNWVESVFSGGRAARRWRRDLRPIDDALIDAETRLQELDVRLQSLAKERGDAVDYRNALYRRFSELQHERAALDKALVIDKQKYGACYPGDEWIDDLRQMELHGAWQEPELNTARADLFLAALHVQQAFLANVRDARKSLHAAFDVMTGDVPRDLAPEVRRSAWQMFFLVVPLVSTTFASVGRMLGNTGPEALGWLFIDEAGQAAPQEAVGAIWRSKRVLAVGDPMQLTPVVTIPSRAQHDLAAKFGISDTWIPSYTSVQKLADRVGRFGTTLTNGADPTWVSSPLRVHRRCDSPMFDVSNAIAYENMMIDGVHRSDSAIAAFSRIEPSVWLDVPSPVPGSHLQRAEIELLRHRIDHLLELGLDCKDIIAISPFRAVARELEQVADDYPGMRGGTIHTAQGREASVVFLVLGGDPQKTGAKSWASSTPNLVNVANSRAQRRLYVIGDKASWQSWPNFSALAEMLEPVSAQH